MNSTSDFKKGLKILIDGQPYVITDFKHFKPGKGNAVTRTKLSNLITGTNLEKTFKSGEKFESPDIDYHKAHFLYQQNEEFFFMDEENYEQYSLNQSLVKDQKNFLIEDLEVTICFFNEKIVGLQLPKTVQLKVTYTEPGFKGNTATNTTKPASLQTGYTIQVPPHIKEGDLLKVNTETGEYLERINL